MEEIQNLKKSRVTREQRDTSMIPCRYFNGPGGCRFGEQCKFRHVITTPMHAPEYQGAVGGQTATADGTYLSGKQIRFRQYPKYRGGTSTY